MITGVRSAADRKFLIKIFHSPHDDEVAERPVEIADIRVVEAGQVNQRYDRPGQEPLLDDGVQCLFVPSSCWSLLSYHITYFHYCHCTLYKLQF